MATEESKWMDRCLIFELERDRAVRCGCDKHIYISSFGSSSTLDTATTKKYTLQTGNNYFDICSGDVVLEDDGTAAQLGSTVETELAGFISNCHDPKPIPERPRTTTRNALSVLI